jgi:tetratricopeptide (TPR) repeat protein
MLPTSLERRVINWGFMKMKKLQTIILSLVLLSAALPPLQAAPSPKEKASYYLTHAVRAKSKLDAIKFLKEGLKEYPNHITIMALLADNYVDMGDLSKANSLYDAFIINSKDNQVKSLLLAHKYKINGDFPSAIKEQTNLLVSLPQLSHESRSEGLFFRAECYFLQKDYKNALSDLNDSIAINPGYYKYYIKRAEVYKALGMDDLADQDINFALSLNQPS